jgi:hypothetical protein
VIGLKRPIKDPSSSSLLLEHKRQMKKLQLFIIISGVLLTSYACAADILITADSKNFCVDFGSGRQSVPTLAKYIGKTLLFSAYFGHSFNFTDIGTDVIQSDIDLPEDSKINNRGVILMREAFEDLPVLIARCSTVELFRFPLAAYRLRI